MKRRLLVWCISACLLFAPQIMSAAWYHFGADDGFSSCNTSETILDDTTVLNLIRVWGIGCDDGYFSVISRAPAVANGMVFSASASGSMLANDMRTGEVKWGFGNGNTVWSPQPTVTTNGNILYLESNINLYTLYCLNGSTGAEIWHSPLQFDLGYNQTTIVTVDEASNTVYMPEVPFGPNSGKLYALDLQTGAVKWYMGPSTHTIALSGDQVLVEGNAVYCATTDGESWVERVTRIDPELHQVTGTFARPAGMTFPEVVWISISNGYIAVLYADDDAMSQTLCTLVVYDLDTMAIEWQYSPGRKSTGSLAINPATLTILLATDPYLYAFNLADGSPKWQYTGYDGIVSPTIANGVIYFLSDTNMYAIRESNGSLIRTFPIGYEVEPTSQVAISDGMLFFSGNGGTCDLFALGFPPECETLGVAIEMPSDYFTPGDPFSCSVTLCNPGAPMTGIPLFVLLEVMGSYYFAPGFSAFDHYTLSVPTGFSQQIVIPEFAWPYTAGEGSGVSFLSAMTNPGMTELLGQMDTCPFSWGYF